MTDNKDCNLVVKNSQSTIVAKFTLSERRIEHYQDARSSAYA